MTVLNQIRVNWGVDCIQNLQYLFFNVFIPQYPCSRNARYFEAISSGVLLISVEFPFQNYQFVSQFIIYIPWNVQIRLKFAKFKFKLI